MSDSRELLDRLAAAEARLTDLTTEMQRLRGARHDDRAEVARVAAAYELTRQEIASLKSAILPRLDHQDQCVDDLKARVQNLEARLLGKGALILLAVEAAFYALGHK